MRMTLTALAALMLSASVLAAQDNGAPAQAPHFATQQSRSEMLSTDFMGMPVIGKNGQQLGHVANLVFDQNGRIELAVIGLGGFLGVGEKHVAVPFETLKAETQNGKNVLAIDLTKAQLDQAPAYTTLGDQSFNQRMAEWREKAITSWNQIKQRAEQAYNEAKAKVTEPNPNQPPQQQEPKQQ